MNADFYRTTPTTQEVDEFRRSHNGRNPRVYRVVCKACGKRMWGSGLGVGSHRRACPGSAPKVERPLVATVVEKHAVFATDHQHRRYRVSRWLGWNEAQDEWTRLDDLRRTGALPQAKFYSVRSQHDPQWNDSPYQVWFGQTATERGDSVRLSRPERERLVEVAREAGSLDDGNSAVFTELLGDERWNHLDAVVLSEYAWNVARFAHPREAHWN